MMRIELPAVVQTPWEQNNIVPAVLAMPDGEPRAGMVVLHGYTGNKETMYDIASGLAEWGYAVVVPDLPLHGERALGQQGKFEYPFYGDPTGIVNAFENALADVNTCATYLREILDPGIKLGVTGFSMGGCLTILSMARMPELFTTGVSIVGAARLASLFLTSSICTDIRDDLLSVGYNEESLAAVLQPVEATEHPAAVKNLLMIGAVDDHIVPGELVVRTYDSFPDPSNELVMFDGCGHFPTLQDVAEHSLPFLARSF